jgi:hypothetical protein
LADYTGYTIETFVREFPQVGLYITPGEAIDIEYTDSWINDIIFPAIKRSGNLPLVFVRSWFFDLERARKIVGHYPNLYFERKFNVEMIADTLPDPENQIWAELNGNLVVNIHMAANLEPFRWNPPSYIQKCLRNAHREGSGGLHLYPRKSWRWPYGSDVVVEQLQWERDALWFEAWGRYAWDPYRENEGEETYWLRRLERKFGNIDAASSFLSSFETGADVLPALQRLIWLGHDNHTVLSAGAKLIQLEGAAGVPFMELDSMLNIPEFLKKLKNNDIPVDNPIKFLDKKRFEAQKSLKSATRGVQYAALNAAEAHSYEVDAKMSSLVADFYYHKFQALTHKILFENNHEAVKNKKQFLSSLGLSLDAFRQLTQLGNEHYESLSDVPAKHPEKLEMCPYHWRDILPLYEKEYEIYKRESNIIPDSSFFVPSIKGLAGIWYGDPGLKNPDHSYETSDIYFDWSDKTDEFGRNWSAHWFGFIIPAETKDVILECESDRGVRITSGQSDLISWIGKDHKLDWKRG